jgi:hypothetical protein
MDFTSICGNCGRPSQSLSFEPGCGIFREAGIKYLYFMKINKELHNLYFSPSIIRMIKSRRMRCAGYVARKGTSRNVYRILVVKSERKRPMGRPRRTCVDNIKMDHREIGWNGMDWIDLAQDREKWKALVNTVMNLRVP